MSVRAALRHAPHATRGRDKLLFILALGLTNALAEFLAEELRLRAHSGETDCIRTLLGRKILL